MLEDFARAELASHSAAGPLFLGVSSDTPLLLRPLLLLLPFVSALNRRAGTVFVDMGSRPRRVIDNGIDSSCSSSTRCLDTLLAPFDRANINHTPRPGNVNGCALAFNAPCHRAGDGGALLCVTPGILGT
ncbi:hypothetical protein EDB83DRAFT_708860 [Lactarius deliciosus]|nr:hypothetical protein EDB83DRAFT_708860 [Lactarius deliciosus]